MDWHLESIKKEQAVARAERKATELINKLKRKHEKKGIYENMGQDEIRKYDDFLWRECGHDLSTAEVMVFQTKFYDAVEQENYRKV